jgi:hypothetical protein
MFEIIALILWMVVLLETCIVISLNLDPGYRSEILITVIVAAPVHTDAKENVPFSKKFSPSVTHHTSARTRFCPLEAGLPVARSISDKNHARPGAKHLTRIHSNDRHDAPMFVDAAILP